MQWTVLIVDDKRSDRQIIRKSLASLNVNADVKEFDDGQELINFFEQITSASDQRFLALIDLSMRKIDGFETIERLSGTPTGKLTHFVVVSDSDRAADIRRAKEAGCTLYLQKPLTFPKYGELIRQAIEKIRNHGDTSIDSLLPA